MLGNNACGSRALGYGRSVDNVAALRVALADGTVLDLPGAGHEGLAALVDGHLSTVRTEFGRFGRQVSGYSFEHLLPENGRRLDRFLVGSEGTLAVVLEAEVTLVEDAPARALAVLGFPSMADAADAVPVLLAHPLVACEGLGHRIVEVVRTHGGHVPELPPGEGWLFAEVTGADVAEVEALAQAVARTAGVPHRVVTDPAEQATLWRIREDGAGLAARSLDRQAQSGWEDAAVPPDRLGDYLREFDALLRDAGLDGVPYGHFGDGCVHVRIDFALDDGEGRGRFRRFVEDSADLVASYGGSMSGEHGDGRARSELLPRMYSAEALDLMRQAKRLLDPEGLLNPGVLVDPAPFDADLRLASPRRPVLPMLRFAHDDGSFATAVHRCTGVGKCLADNTGAGGVMCPSYVATREEKDSTRGRARVLQELVDAGGGQSVVGGWDDPAVEQALDLCLSCKGCARDCPTGIDMATYKSEALHQRYRRRLRPRSHYALGRLPKWARMTPPRLANRMLRDRTPRPAGEGRRGRRPAAGAAGVFGGTTAILPVVEEVETSGPAGRRRRLGVGRLVHRPVRCRHRPRGRAAARGGRTAGAGDPRGGLLRADLDHHGPARPGAADPGPRRRHAPPLRRLRRAGGRAGAELPGHPALRRRGAARRPPRRRGGARRALAGRAASGLDGWSPRDLTGVEVVAQPHCHQASVLGWDADLGLLTRAGATVTRLGGCCGLAGNFGVEQGHYEVSVAIAEHTLLPAVRRAGEGAVVLADGFSCRTQLDDLAGVRALHLAELLAGDQPF